MLTFSDYVIFIMLPCVFVLLPQVRWLHINVIVSFLSVGTTEILHGVFYFEKKTRYSMTFPRSMLLSLCPDVTSVKKKGRASGIR